jgi:hypothetical protein
MSTSLLWFSLYLRREDILNCKQIILFAGILPLQKKFHGTDGSSEVEKSTPALRIRSVSEFEEALPLEHRKQTTSRKTVSKHILQEKERHDHFRKSHRQQHLPASEFATNMYVQDRGVTEKAGNCD